MKTRLLLASAATAVALSFALPSLAADNAQEFVNKAAIGGMFEVDSSKVATTKAQDQHVKDFAQKMIEDHGAAVRRAPDIPIRREQLARPQFAKMHPLTVKRRRMRPRPRAAVVITIEQPARMTNRQARHPEERKGRGHCNEARNEDDGPGSRRFHDERLQ